MFSSNAITDNVRDGVECNSQVQTLTMDGNTISGQRHGAGVVVRAGGAGHWQQNTITGNAVGVEIGAGASPDLVQCTIHGNLREGCMCKMPGGPSCDVARSAQMATGAW